MDGQPQPLLSVRGDARLVVPPDYAVLHGQLSATRDSKAEALREVATVLDQLRTDLAGLGGTPRSLDSERDPLTWVAHGATTHPEHDERKGRTGRMVAAVFLELSVRDFGLLAALGSLLSTREPLQLHQVSWHVDWDNPAWPRVRADAIKAAIRTGHDYAAALGSSLSGVVHIADSGLLGGDGSGARLMAAGAMRRPYLEPDSPSLDPVPQELSAVVEARFTLAGVNLASFTGSA
jgi:uncharacterized protein YggE